MTIPTEPDLLCMWGVRDTILSISPSIIPQTTLRALATVGTDALSIVPLLNADGNSRFPFGGQISFSDWLGEEEGLPIDTSDTAGNITLNVAGLGYAGLQYGHSDHAPVYCNLQVGQAWEIAKFLGRGDPFIWITTKAHRVPAPPTQGKTWDSLKVHIQYHRQLTRLPESDIDADRWANRQEIAARQDLEKIRIALMANHNLRGPSTGGEPVALTFGTRGKTDDWLTSYWDKFPAEDDTWQFIAYIDVIVTPQQRNARNF